MKRVLILTIALLSLAGVAFSDFVVSGQATYGMAMGWLNGTTPLINNNDNDNRIYFKSSSTALTSYVELRLLNQYLGQAADSIDVRSYYVQLNVINALQITDPLPIKVIVQLGQDEEKVTEVWDITHLQYERQGATDLKLISHSVGWFVRATFFDVATLTFGQETYATGAPAAAREMYATTLAPTMIDLTASYSIVKVATAVKLSQATAVADMVAAFDAGAMVDLSSLLGFMTLKISAVIATFDLINSDTWYFGMGLRAEYAAGDLKILGSVGAAGVWATVDSMPIAGVGLAAEVWFKMFGLGLAANLAFEAGDGTANVTNPGVAPDTMIGNIEIFVLANLGGLTVNFGYIYVPEEVWAAGANTPFNARLVEFGVEKLPGDYTGSANRNFGSGFAFRTVAKL